VLKVFGAPSLAGTCIYSLIYRFCRCNGTAKENFLRFQLWSRLDFFRIHIAWRKAVSLWRKLFTCRRAQTGTPRGNLFSVRLLMKRTLFKPNCAINPITTHNFNWGMEMVSFFGVSVGLGHENLLSSLVPILSNYSVYWMDHFWRWLDYTIWQIEQPTVGAFGSGHSYKKQIW
jgi:hypothetical protein